MSSNINDPRRADLVKILLANPLMSAKEAMLKAGYSESYANASTNLTKSKSFLEKMDEAIGDDKIVATVRALLNRRDLATIDWPLETEDKEILEDVENRGGEFPKIKVITLTRHVEAGTEEDPDDEFLEDDQPKKKRKKYVEEEYQIKQVKFYVSDRQAVDAMLDKLFKLRGDYAPEKKKLIGVIGITQLLNELQDGEQTHKPIQTNGEPI